MNQTDSPYKYLPNDVENVPKRKWLGCWVWEQTETLGRRPRWDEGSCRRRRSRSRSCRRRRIRRREDECQPSFGVAAFSPKNGGTSFQVWNSVQLWGADSNKTEKMRSCPLVRGSWRRGNMGRLLARTLFGLLWVGWSYAQDGPLVSFRTINIQLQRSTYFAILCKICQIVCLHHTLIKMGSA